MRHDRPAAIHLAALAAALLMAATVPVRAATPLQRVRQAEGRRVELIRTITPTVISVFRVHRRTGELARGSGSGVIISPDGYALTNYHVTGPAEELRVGLPGGEIRKAHRLGVDPTGDVAVIRIDSDEPLPYAPLGKSDELAVGQWVVAMGNPFLLATDFRPTVSLGVVSGLHRYLPGSGQYGHQLIYADAIQVDAALNPGNSGGPLFDLEGNVVGINGRITLRRVEGMRMSRTNMGVGFAVPIDAIKVFLEDMKAGIDVDRGYLGVSGGEGTDEGIEVTEIELDSPAEIFGIRVGDVLLSVDGVPVREAGELHSVVQLRPSGAWVDVRVRRDGQELTIPLQLAGVQSTIWLHVRKANTEGAEDESILRPPPGPARPAGDVDDGAGPTPNPAEGGDS